MEQYEIPPQMDNNLMPPTIHYIQPTEDIAEDMQWMLDDMP